MQAMHAAVKVANKSSTASGFLVACPVVSDPPQQRVLLVTAAHVFEQMSGDTCRIVVRLPDENGHWQRSEQQLSIRSGDKPCWVRHPEADVGVLAVDLPEKAAAAALPCDCIADHSAITAGTIRTGQDVWIACYPVQLEANSSGFAVLRRGIIASYPLAPVETYKTFLVDYSTFGGDSGAVVVALVPAAANGSPPGAEGLLVVGLVSGQHRQTEKVVLPSEERTTHHPLGLAIVVPAELIRQTIRQATE